MARLYAVSYTHLDVYKRQTFNSTVKQFTYIKLGVAQEGQREHWRCIDDSAVKRISCLRGHEAANNGQLCTRGAVNVIANGGKTLFLMTSLQSPAGLCRHNGYCPKG